MKTKYLMGFVLFILMSLSGFANGGVASRNSPLVLIAGLVGTILILLYTAFNIDKEHLILKFILILFSFMLLMIIPKAALDADVSCAFLVKNETTAGNVISFEYEEVCATTDATTATPFFKTISMVTRLVYYYMFIYFVWLMFVNFTAVGKKVVSKMGKNKEGE